VGGFCFLSLDLQRSCRRNCNRAWNLLPNHRPTAIANLVIAPLRFARRDFALGQRIIPVLSFHLEVPVVAPYHPVVADDSPPFLMKNLPPIPRSTVRGAARLIVPALRRGMPKPPFVLRQIFLLQGERASLQFKDRASTWRPCQIDAIKAAGVFSCSA
jgi:hypothetical protein